MSKGWVFLLLVICLGIFAFIFYNNNNFVIKSNQCFDEISFGKHIQKNTFDKLINTCEDGICRSIVTKCSKTEVDKLYFPSIFDCKPELLSCKDSCDELYEDDKVTKNYKDFCKRECRIDNCKTEIFDKSDLSKGFLEEKCSEENNVYSCSYEQYVVKEERFG